VLVCVVRPHHLEKRAEARLGALVGGHLKGLPVVVSYCEPSLTGEDHEILKAVRLSYSSVSDADLTVLRDLRRIGMLHLSNTNISNKGIQFLGELVDLRHLWLDNTLITDAGIVHLRNLTHLRSLSMNGTLVSDQIINVLCRMSGLKVLALGDTRISANGRVALSTALPDCVIIQ
jgi:hypothetical protein